MPQANFSLMFWVIERCVVALVFVVYCSWSLGVYKFPNDYFQLREKHPFEEEHPTGRALAGCWDAPSVIHLARPEEVWPLAGVYFSEKRGEAGPMVNKSHSQLGFRIQSVPSWRGTFIIQDKGLEMTSCNQLRRKGINAQCYYVFGPSSHCSEGKKQTRSPLVIFLFVLLETCLSFNLTHLIFV